MAALTLAAQEIAPLPAVADPDRRRRAEASLKLFAETYFPKVFYKAWSKDHLRVIDKLEKVIRERWTMAVAMPRGSGKSALCQVGILWAVLPGHCTYAMLIRSTEDEAVEGIGGIKTHLLENDLLLSDFPESVYPIRRLENEGRRCKGQRYYGIPTRIEWSEDQIVLPTMPGAAGSGAIITVRWIKGKIRGAAHVRPDGRQVRPVLAICDDPQTDESARSPLQTKERLDIIRGAVVGLAGPGEYTSVIVPCTVIRPGDLADQLLDRKKNPSWHGEKTRMLYSLPTNTKLWNRYRELLEDAQRRDEKPGEALEFYGARVARCGLALDEVRPCETCNHRAGCMDAGAVVAWTADYSRGSLEFSAVQHAMNLLFRNSEVFWAEYQNDPLRPGQLSGQSVLTFDEVCHRANGRPRGEVPLECTRLTMFVDVHDNILYFCMAAWREDFTGFIIDYGTFPDQGRAFFTQDSVTRTLGREFPGAGVDGAIQAGLMRLVSERLGRDYPRGDGLMRIDRLLVDMGYKPNIVAAVKHGAGGAVMMLSRGMGLKAARQPMASWKRRPGEQHGNHWYVPNVARTAEFPHVGADVNYWKTFVHGALQTAPGDPTSLTIFGRPEEHELFARHVADGEQWVDVTALGRTVREWSVKPGRPDNHWFDCLVGCAVAASMCGCKVPGMEAGIAARRVVSIRNRKRIDR